MLGTTMLKMCSTLKLGLAIVALAALAGCQSKNPIEYLPKSSAGYMGMNIAKMKDSAQMKKLFSDENGNMTPNASSLITDKAKRLYVAFDTPEGATAPTNYSVAIGDAGFAEEVVKAYKAAGATEAKVSGHDTYTSGPVTVAPVGSTGILVYTDPSSLSKMIDVSKKKAEGARTSAEFNFVDGQLNDHAVAVATKAAPLLTLAGPALGQIDAMNPGGAKALREVSMLSMTFNWDKEPVIDIHMQLADKANSELLKGLVDQGVALLYMMPMISGNPDAKAVMSNMKTSAAEDGVNINLTIPEAVANKLIEQLESAAAKQQGAFNGAPSGAMPPPE